MEKVTELEIYKTINILALALIIVFILKGYILLLIIAGVLLLNNLLFLKVNKIITEYWLAFARIAGSINSKIILTLIFFIFLTPIAFLYRLFNPTAVKKFKENRESLFENANFTLSKESFRKQW